MKVTIDLWKERGSLYIGNKEHHYISDNCIIFKDCDRDTVLSQEDMEEWALCLNSPWDNGSMKYEIECERYATDAQISPLLWKCTYSVTGYEMTTASCVGYGRDAKAAFIECQRLFEFLQKRYNPQGDAF